VPRSIEDYALVSDCYSGALVRAADAIAAVELPRLELPS
jgi:hypothetical protein